MTKFLLIGLGGFLGAILRYIISTYVQLWAQSCGIPYGTLVVNLLGCLLIGLGSQLAANYHWFTPELRFLILVGFLGAFTTFSTYSNEGIGMIQDDRMSAALFYMGGSVILGLCAVWVGQRLVS